MNADPDPDNARTSRPADPDQAPGGAQPAAAQNIPDTPSGGQQENAGALATYAVTLFVNSGEAPLVQPGGAADMKARMGWQPPESSLRLRDRSV